MTKYILVSGGVVSGIGKGVIGVVFCFFIEIHVALNPVFFSVVNRIVIEDHRPQSDCYQDRPLYEYRCWDDETD